MMDYSFKIIKINYDFVYKIFFLLNHSKHTRNLCLNHASDCLCQAGPTSWSVTLLLNRNSPNIMPLCTL